MQPRPLCDGGQLQIGTLPVLPHLSMRPARPATDFAGESATMWYGPISPLWGLCRPLSWYYNRTYSLFVNNLREVVMRFWLYEVALTTSRRFKSLLRL